MTRVLVCGGRDFTDYAFVSTKLAELEIERGIDCVIHGAARGADSLAGQWARESGHKEIRFPASWTIYGKAAGFIRNQQMLDEGKPDFVVAFRGGKGTADMVRRAKTAGLQVIQL